MTQSELRTRILDALNDSSASPIFWATSELNAVIDEGSEILAEEARLIKRSAMTTLRPGTSYYHIRGIAPDMMAPYKLTLPDSHIELRAVSPIELDAFHEYWLTVPGTPRWWAPISWDIFALFPHATVGGDQFVIDYLAWPRALLDDNDSPEYAEADHDALVLYGIYDGLMKRWDGQRGLLAFNAFLERAGISKGSSGMGQYDGRTWQAAAQPGTPWLGGLDNAYR